MRINQGLYWPVCYFRSHFNPDGHHQSPVGTCSPLWPVNSPDSIGGFEQSVQLKNRNDLFQLHF